MKEPLLCEIVRALRPDDLAELNNPVAVAAPRQTVAKITHAHHVLAQQLARGITDLEAGLIAGYNNAYISGLKRDPAFQELLAYYQTQRELVHVDVLKRMESLGIQGLDELQARLTERPEDFTPRELMEFTELMLVKGRAAPGSRAPGASGGAAPVNITIGFVRADHKPMIEAGQ